MKRIITLALLASFMLTYTAPVIAIENTAKKTKQERVKTTKIKPTKNKYDYINMEWWQGFNDSYLNDYIIKALEKNHDLKMASLTIDEFYQKVAMQRAGELPMIQGGFMPNYGKTLTGKAHESFALPLLASYELDLFGKNHNKTTSVKKLYEASILDERTAYISIASAVGGTYLNIVKLDSMIDIQEDIVKLRKEIFEIMEISNAEGIVSTADLVQANQSYIMAVTDLTEYKKERTKLLHALAVLTGDSPNNIEEYKRSDYKTLTFKGSIPEYVSSEIIMQRPDYLKAEKMLEKAGVDVRIARKECLPTINLGGLMLFSADQFGHLLTTSDMFWGLGGGIMANIFAGGSIRANLKSKKIAYEKSLQNYEKTNLTSMQEVNDSLVSVNMDREKLTKQRKIQELERKNYELSKLKYQEGVIAKLDLNQRMENMLNVNKMVYVSEFNCLIDYIGYYKAVGAKA